MILLWQYPNKPYCRCKALWEDRWFLLSHSLESEGVIKHEEKRGGICVLFSHTSSPSRKSYLPPSSFKLICCWLFLKSSKSPSVKPWPLPLYSTLLSSIIQLTISIPPTSLVFFLPLISKPGSISVHLFISVKNSVQSQNSQVKPWLFYVCNFSTLFSTENNTNTKKKNILLNTCHLYIFQP